MDLEYVREVSSIRYKIKNYDNKAKYKAGMEVMKDQKISNYKSKKI